MGETINIVEEDEARMSTRHRVVCKAGMSPAEAAGAESR